MRIFVIDDARRDAAVLSNLIEAKISDCFDCLDYFKTWQQFKEENIELNKDSVVFCPAVLLENKEVEIRLFEAANNQSLVILFHYNCDYSIKALKLGFFDYLQIPFDCNELIDCFNRISKRFNCNKIITNIVLRDAKGSQIIPLKSISYIQAHGAYSRIYSTEKEYFICRTLKSLEEEIGEPFIRIHRSYMVHSSQIKYYNVNTVTLINQQKLPVSRAGRVKLVTEIPQAVLVG